MSNIIQINPFTDIDYHLDDSKIEGVSLSPTGTNKLYIGSPCGFTSGKYSSVYLDGGFHDFKTDELKNLMIAWLAIVDPSVLNFDKE